MLTFFSYCPGVEGLELDGPGSVSPIAHAVTPYMIDRESAELPSFSTTVDNKPNRGNGSEVNRENGGKEGDTRQRDKDRGDRNLRSNPRSPGDDNFDVELNNRNLFKDGYDNIGPDSVNQRDRSHGDEWDYPIQKNKNGIKSMKKVSDDQSNHNVSEGGNSGSEKTLSLLTVCANAYQLLCMYRCREVRTFTSSVISMNIFKRYCLMLCLRILSSNLSFPSLLPLSYVHTLYTHAHVSSLHCFTDCHVSTTSAAGCNTY